MAVAIVARDAARLEAAAAEVARETSARCVAVPADLTDAAQLEAAMTRAQEALGRADILVSNTGATPMGSIGDTPGEAWMESVDIKLLGYRRCARVLTPLVRTPERTTSTTHRSWARISNQRARNRGPAKRPARRAFAVTAKDEVAITSAAPSGVTKPATAAGTATAL